MDPVILQYFLSQYTTWCHTPANDNWPVSDEIAISLCKKIG